jgi:hypothetical protein
MIMKKQMTKLTLSRETLRNLDTKALGNALGGQPIATSGDPTLGTQCLTLNCA